MNIQKYQPKENRYFLGNGLDENSENIIDRFGLTYYTQIKQLTYGYIWRIK